MEQSVKMQEKMIMVAYEAPMVEVIKVEVEKGFAASSGDLINNNWPNS